MLLNKSNLTLTNYYKNNMFSQIFALKQKPHAIIIKLASLSSFDCFLKQYIKSIVCDSTPACNKCQWCKKVDQNGYFDLQIFDAFEMKKQDMQNLKVFFTKTGLESKNKKFYVIKNIENVNKQIANGLLKFIEEPPENVFAIFTTKAFNCVLPTIKSRCLSLILKKDDKKVNEILSKYDKKTRDFFLTLAQRQYIDFENLEKYISIYTKNIKNIECLISPNYLDVINDVLLFFKKSSDNELNFFLEIVKQKVDLQTSLEIAKMQHLLSLNLNQSLLLNNLLKLLKH